MPTDEEGPPSDEPESADHDDEPSVLWVADLGPRAKLGDLANHFRDLDCAVELGERVDVLVNIAIARQEVALSLLREGPRALVGEVESLGLGFSYDDLDELHHWLGSKRRSYARPDYDLRAGMYFQVPPADTLDLIATAMAARRQRNAGRTRVVTAAYRNPLEIALCGVMLGVALILKMIRDWSSMQRVAAANASIAESRARQEASRADLAQYITSEIRERRLPVPPHVIAELAAGTNVEAINRLAASEISLESPHGHEEPSAPTEGQA